MNWKKASANKSNTICNAMNPGSSRAEGRQWFSSRLCSSMTSFHTYRAEMLDAECAAAKGLIEER